jgi:hypothetical protein
MGARRREQNWTRGITDRRNTDSSSPKFVPASERIAVFDQDCRYSSHEIDTRLRDTPKSWRPTLKLGARRTGGIAELSDAVRVHEPAEMNRLADSLPAVELQLEGRDLKNSRRISSCESRAYTYDKRDTGFNFNFEPGASAVSSGCRGRLLASSSCSDPLHPSREEKGRRVRRQSFGTGLALS